MTTPDTAEDADRPQRRPDDRRAGEAILASSPPPRRGSRGRARFEFARADLAPETRDEDLDSVRIAIGILGVNMFGQLCLRHDTIAVVHEIGEHTEFVARELQRRTVERRAGRPADPAGDPPQRSAGVT